MTFKKEQNLLELIRTSKIDTLKSLLSSETFLSVRKEDSTGHSHARIISKHLPVAGTIKDVPCFFHDGYSPRNTTL